MHKSTPISIKLSITNIDNGTLYSSPESMIKNLNSSLTYIIATLGTTLFHFVMLIQIFIETPVLTALC